MALRHARGRKATMPQLLEGQFAVTKDTEEVFAGINQKNVRVLDEKDKTELLEAIENIEVDIDTSGLATKTELQEAIENVEVDTTNLATKPELNSVTTQLADKAGKSEARLKTQKIEPEDWSERALALATGEGTINLLSVPQDNSVTPAKLTTETLGTIENKSRNTTVYEEVLKTNQETLMNQLPGVNNGTLSSQNIYQASMLHSFVNNPNTAPFKDSKIPKASRFTFNNKGTGVTQAYLGYTRKGSPKAMSTLGFWVNKNDLLAAPSTQIRPRIETWNGTTYYDAVQTGRLNTTDVIKTGYTQSITQGTAIVSISNIAELGDWIYLIISGQGLSLSANEIRFMLNFYNANPNTTAKVDIVAPSVIDDVTRTSPYFVYPESEGDKVAKMSDIASIADSVKTEFELLLPDNMYFINEEPLRVYKSSILSNYKNRHTLDLAISSQRELRALPFIEQQREKIEIDPMKLGETFNITVADNDLNSYIGKTINKKSVTAANVTNKNPTLLMFGDSTTQRFLPYFVRTVISPYVTPTFIGTVDDSGSVKCEARGGWLYAQYVGYRTLNNAGANMTTFPSFLKLATAEDKQRHPEWCFTRTFSAKEQNYNQATDKNQNFYIFDFAHYLSVNGFNAPDVVTISMGTNDLSVYGDEGVSICKMSAEIMIQQIHAASPNTKICLNTLPINGGGIEVSARRTSWIKECIKNINPKYDYIDVVCEYAHQSKEFSWDLTPTANPNRLDNSYTITDTVHTSHAGTREGAVPIAYYILNQL